MIVRIPVLEELSVVERSERRVLQRFMHVQLTRINQYTHANLDKPAIHISRVQVVSLGFDINEAPVGERSIRTAAEREAYWSRPACQWREELEMPQDEESIELIPRNFRPGAGIQS